ncbi:NAD(P)-dependent oxidoreductase [bacterium]|nr:NAD(P)-dependent oxidoreductase [bacterium]
MVGEAEQRLRLLVTGASGFVGSQVVRAALASGHQVIALVRSRAGAARLAGLSGDLRLVEADLADAAAMRRAAREAAADAALHLAWSIGPDYRDTPANLACVQGSLALLEGLLDGACQRIVFAGSHLELAASAGDMDETLAVAPRSLYAVCKDALHRIADTYAAARGASFAWARLFNLYGPGQPDWALVPSIIAPLLAGRPCAVARGAQVRAFLHVRDVADALLALARSPLGGTVHVGTETGISVRALALRIGERLGRADLLAFPEPEALGAEPPRIVPCTARLAATVGFRPRIDLDDGLADTIEWWRAHRPSMVDA